MECNAPGTSVPKQSVQNMAATLPNTTVPRTYYLEHRRPNGRNSLSWDLARHAYTRVTTGRILVLSDNPVPLLSSFKKQWLQLCRRVQRERASTFNTDYIMQFTRQISLMQGLNATTESPVQVPDADLYILTPAQVVEHITLLPHFRTLYVVCDVSPEFLETLSADLPERALVTIYRGVSLFSNTICVPKEPVLNSRP